jgi:hypothetical protein
MPPYAWLLVAVYLWGAYCTYTTLQATCEEYEWLSGLPQDSQTKTGAIFVGVLCLWWIVPIMRSAAFRSRQQPEAMAHRRLVRRKLAQLLAKEEFDLDISDHSVGEARRVFDATNNANNVKR